MVGNGHERALALLFVLLVGMVGGAFASILILLCLALKDVSAKDRRSRQAGARASILTTVVASAMLWVVATASPLPCIAVGTPAGVEGVACVAVEAETLMHRNRGARSVALLLLVDRHVLVGLL